MCSLDNCLDREDRREPDKAAKPCKAAKPPELQVSLASRGWSDQMTSRDPSEAEFFFACSVYMLTSSMTKEAFVINRVWLNLQVDIKTSWVITVPCFKMLQYGRILTPTAVLHLHHWRRVANCSVFTQNHSEDGTGKISSWSTSETLPKQSLCYIRISNFLNKGSVHQQQVMCHSELLGVEIVCQLKFVEAFSGHGNLDYNFSSTQALCRTILSLRWHTRLPVPAIHQLSAMPPQDEAPEIISPYRLNYCIWLKNTRVPHVVFRAMCLCRFQISSFFQPWSLFSCEAQSGELVTKSSNYNKNGC